MTDIMHDPYADEYAPEASTGKEQNEASRRLITPFGIVIVLATLILVGVVAYGIYQNEQGTINDGPAPDFTLTIYDDSNIAYADDGTTMQLTGETISLAEFDGPVVLNFWQTTCPPCHEEAPMLRRVSNDYLGQGVVFIGINVKDPDRMALDYIATYDITYPNGLDRGDEIQDLYRTTGLPETFVIDTEGIIIAHWAGQPTEAALRDAIDEALLAVAS